MINQLYDLINGTDFEPMLNEMEIEHVALRNQDESTLLHLHSCKIWWSSTREALCDKI